jgi:hypothetical protein
MSSTPTAILGLQKQGTGDNSGSWGVVANTQLDLVEEAIAGTTTVSLASADVVLTTTDYAANQARPSHILANGALAASRTITVPAKSKLYCITNSTTQTTDYQFSVTIKTASGTGVTIPSSGRPVWVRCDGTNVVAVNGLPFCSVGTTTHISLADTDNAAALTWAAADQISDLWGMADHANNRITPPAGCELFQITVNVLMNEVIIPTTTQASVGIMWQSGSPGSTNGMPYQLRTTQSGAGVATNYVFATGLFHMPNKTLGSTDRLDYFTFEAQLNVSTASAQVNAFEINAVALR